MFPTDYGQREREREVRKYFKMKCGWRRRRRRWSWCQRAVDRIQTKLLNGLLEYILPWLDRWQIKIKPKKIMIIYLFFSSLLAEQMHHKRNMMSAEESVHMFVPPQRTKSSWSNISIFLLLAVLLIKSCARPFASISLPTAHHHIDHSPIHIQTHEGMCLRTTFVGRVKNDQKQKKRVSKFLCLFILLVESLSFRYEQNIWGGKKICVFNFISWILYYSRINHMIYEYFAPNVHLWLISLVFVCLSLPLSLWLKNGFILFTISSFKIFLEN